MLTKSVYIVSSNPQWSSLIEASLSLSFPTYTLVCEASVDALWNLDDDALIVYDRDTLGNPSALLISPLSRGGLWIIVNAIRSDLDGVLGLIALGYCGVIEKEQTIESLHKALRTVIGGQLWFSREAMSLSLRSSMKNHVATTSSFAVVCAKYSLSAKEQKVFLYAVQGYSNKEIASELSLGLSTVKTHISNILMKTGKHSRSQLNTLLSEPEV